MRFVKVSLYFWRAEFGHNILGMVYPGTKKMILLYPDFYHICILVLNNVLTKFYTRLQFVRTQAYPHTINKDRDFMSINHIKNISPLCILLANAHKVMNILLDSN